MIDFSEFNETLPSFKPMLDFDTWLPLLVFTPIAVMVVFAFRGLIRKTGELPPSSGRRVDENYAQRVLRAFSTDLFSVHSIVYRGLPTLLAVGVLTLTITQIPLPKEHHAAAAETFAQIEQKASEKYAIAGLEPVAQDNPNAVSDTVESIRDGAPTGVQAVLPDGTTVLYWLEDSKDGLTLANPDGRANQKDPAELLAADVLERKAALLEDLEDTYDVQDIAPPTSSDPDDPAAWLRTFGPTVEDSAPSVRVIFTDGQQSILRVVDTGDGAVLVGTGTVDPDDYAR